MWLEELILMSSITSLRRLTGERLRRARAKVAQMSFY
jgi:hypothetical protein